MLTVQFQIYEGMQGSMCDEHVEKLHHARDLGLRCPFARIMVCRNHSAHLLGYPRYYQYSVLLSHDCTHEIQGIRQSPNGMHTEQISDGEAAMTCIFACARCCILSHGD